jgi:predicted amidohydrolase YtcJ
MTDADLVFTGAVVYTADAARSRYRALAVRAGRIVALGAAACAELTGARTEVVDLAGGMVLPGFNDAHIHPVQGGVELGRCDLTGASSEAECVARIGAYAAANPDATWLTGGGWAMASFPGGVPESRAIDAVVADRPVFLLNRDHHGAWVNSRALELAGIDAATPDPRDGRIERDASGRPSGMLQEGAVDLVARLVPPSTEDELEAGLLRAQALLHSYGITGWQDALVGAGLGQPDNYGAYVRLAGSGALTARVRGALWWERDRDVEQVEELIARRALGMVGRFEPTHVKIMLDGVCENFTAAMLAPYLDSHGHPTTNAGLTFVDSARLPGYVARLDAEGFGVHLHALGDRAVRDGLDAVQAARRLNGWLDNRHSLAHLQVVEPADLPRFRQLGAIANIQPLWAVHDPQMDELTIPFLGEARSRNQYPWGALLREGAVLAAGSDWPVTSPDPVLGIHVAVNRVEPGGDGPAFLPEQRLDLAAAIAAYTSGSAWANGFSGCGTLAVGNHADLVVLDRDPFEAPASEIADARVRLTYVDGQRVYGG